MTNLKGARKRAYKPKSTTGCITCKIRRIKCDEARPHCNRCTSTGRKCDGYTSSPPTDSLPAVSQLDTVPGLFHRTLSLIPQLETSEEQESYSFFERHTVLELPGFFSSSFWQREVLQAAQRQPSIRYAVVALSALHRRYVTGRMVAGPDKELKFALRQCNRAIQETLSPESGCVAGTWSTGKTALITIMTICVLFNCMACMQGHQKEAMQHLRSGIQLLRETDDEDEREGCVMMGERPANHAVSLNSLRNIFVGLDLQARSLMNTTELAEWGPVPRRRPPSSLNSSSSLEDVQLHLQSTLNEFMAFVQSLGGKNRPPDSAWVQKTFCGLKERAEEGGRMLELSQPCTIMAAQDHQTIVALRLLRSVVDLSILSFEAKSFRGGVGPASFDQDARLRFSSMMDEISSLMGPSEAIELQEWTLRNPNPSPLQSTKRPVFSFTFGVLATLWWVAQSAPSPTLRSKAILMMMEHPLREGLWDGPVAGRIALEAVMLEIQSVKNELGDSVTGEEVPEYLRIRDISIEYVGTTSAMVEFRNRRAIERGEKGWVKHMKW